MLIYNSSKESAPLKTEIFSSEFKYPNQFDILDVDQILELYPSVSQLTIEEVLHRQREAKYSIGHIPQPAISETEGTILGFGPESLYGRQFITFWEFRDVFDAIGYYRAVADSAQRLEEQARVELPSWIPNSPLDFPTKGVSESFRMGQQTLEYFLKSHKTHLEIAANRLKVLNNTRFRERTDQTPQSLIANLKEITTETIDQVTLLPQKTLAAEVKKQLLGDVEHNLWQRGSASHNLINAAYSRRDSLDKKRSPKDREYFAGQRMGFLSSVHKVIATQIKSLDTEVQRINSFFGEDESETIEDETLRSAA